MNIETIRREALSLTAQKRAELAEQLLSSLDAAMVHVCEVPEQYRVEFPPTIRRFHVPGFPFNILYRTVGADIEVLVVAPHRRRPGYWLGRR